MHPDRAKTSNEFPQIPVWRVVYVKNIGRKIKQKAENGISLRNFDKSSSEAYSILDRNFDSESQKMVMKILN